MGADAAFKPQGIKFKKEYKEINWVFIASSWTAHTYRSGGFLGSICFC